MEADDLDLEAFLGVSVPQARRPEARRGKAPKVVECGGQPPRAKVGEWAHPVVTFAFSGYVALVTRCRCTTCDALWDRLEGIFIEEKHLPSGTRRLQEMGAKGDWPAQGGHRKEVSELDLKYCGNCIGGLGFDREVDSHGLPFKMVFREDGK